MVNRKISRDVKERAAALVLSGSNVPSVAHILGVSVDSSFGNVQPRSALRGRRRTLSCTVLEDLHTLILSSPSLYLDEIISWLTAKHDQPVSISTLQRSLLAFGYTYKKLQKAAAQRDEITRTHLWHLRWAAATSTAVCAEETDLSSLSRSSTSESPASELPETAVR
ncbi:hypothetical protein C2E23DRAFT_849610 [Lenzites betulinus]|nr:hypothetical protein C2E23DRAFT_849610 [Lenzites betulinus]